MTQQPLVIPWSFAARQWTRKSPGSCWYCAPPLLLQLGYVGFRWRYKSASRWAQSNCSLRLTAGFSARCAGQYVLFCSFLFIFFFLRLISIFLLLAYHTCLQVMLSAFSNKCKLEKSFSERPNNLHVLLNLLRCVSADKRLLGARHTCHSTIRRRCASRWSANFCAATRSGNLGCQCAGASWITAAPNDSH